MIQFKHISKRFDNGHAALKQVSFTLAKGEMAFLTGHSGAGKSTILNIIALFENISQGELLMDNNNISALSERKKPFIRRQMGIISQSPKLLMYQTVYHNVALPMIVGGNDANEIPRRVRAALDKVGLLDKEKVLCINLSLGEQQRVNIARAVVNRPALLIADEPTGNLDPALSKEIMQLFEEFNRVGTSILIATHDLALIATMRNRILTLSKGRLLNGGDA